MRLQRRLYGICSGFLAVGHYWLISVHQITHWNAETKNQAFNRHILEFRVVFTVLSFVGNPVYKLYLPHWYSNIDLKDLVILPGYMCCLKRAGSTLVQTGQFDKLYIYSTCCTCCTGLDHATFRVGCNKLGTLSTKL